MLESDRDSTHHSFGKVDVTRSGACAGYSYDITFKTRPGEQHLLVVNTYRESYLHKAVSQNRPLSNIIYNVCVCVCAYFRLMLLV